MPKGRRWHLSLSALEDRTKPAVEVALDLSLKSRLPSDEDVVPVEVLAHPGLDASLIQLLDPEDMATTHSFGEKAVGQISTPLSPEGSAGSRAGELLAPTFPTLSTRFGPAGQVVP